MGPAPPIRVAAQLIASRMNFMSTLAPSPLPRWDLASAFPGLDSKEFAEGFVHLEKGIEEYQRLLAAAENAGFDLSEDLIGRYEALMAHTDQLRSLVRTMSAYIECCVSVNSRDELAQKKESEMEVATIPLAKLDTRFTAWLGALPTPDLAVRSEVGRNHRFALEKAAIAARHLMSPAEESLSADLQSTSASAWERLHNSVSSQIEVDLGEGEKRPMSVVRALAYDSDPDVRRAAYHAELKAWRDHEVPVAAAMNGIKGTVATLTRRRGWKSPLDEALFTANIDRETLDAMLGAALESFPIFRRYLQTKARALGQEKLPFYDMFAPISSGSGSRSWQFEEGAEFVARQFRSFSDKLGSFAERSYREKWIDAEPRPGKADGAYCTWLIGDESRVFMNYKTSFGSVKTLAHELGHAYHNLCLTGRTMAQRRTPMTLAETASIFCETIVKNAALKEVPSDEQVAILEGSLQSSCQVVVDITSRFLFEQKVFEGRSAREFTPAEFCELMVWAQNETYGDGLDKEFLHPYMWAAKPHYYATRSFYNFPYMYGLLFALGLYAEYEKDAEHFKARYDDLLSSTGMDDAATLATRFGIDVRKPGFWKSSLGVLEREIGEFERQVSFNNR